MIGYITAALEKLFSDSLSLVMRHRGASLFLLFHSLLDLPF